MDSSFTTGIGGGSPRTSTDRLRPTVAINISSHPLLLHVEYYDSGTGVMGSATIAPPGIEHLLERPLAPTVDTTDIDIDGNANLSQSEFPTIA